MQDHITTNADASSSARAHGDVRPWPRFWARQIDYLLFGITAVFAVITSEYDLPELNDLVFPVLVSAIWVVMEAGLLSSFGTTPGKWLMGIRVERFDGRLLSFETAFKRSLSPRCAIRELSSRDSSSSCP